MAQQRRCPFCEESVIGDAKVCHLCGHELPQEGGSGKSGRESFWATGRTFLLVVVVALVAIAVVLALRTWLARPFPLIF